jgi:hypothetical protein
MGSRNQTTIIGGVVALVLIASGLVYGITVAGKSDTGSTPLLSNVLGFVGLAIVGLLALLKGDTAAKAAGDASDKAEAAVVSAQTSEVRVASTQEAIDGLTNGKLTAAVATAIAASPLHDIDHIANRMDRLEAEQKVKLDTIGRHVEHLVIKAGLGSLDPSTQPAPMRDLPPAAALLSAQMAAQQPPRFDPYTGQPLQASQ